MYLFKAWAPRAASLSLQVGGESVPMSGPDPQGWWSHAVESADHGTDYGFLIDGNPGVLPDPRSMWQPCGVHGLSRVYDQRRFRWSDHGFQAAPLASAVVYELHPGTFTPEGTLDSAIEKLGYLRALGISHVELMPIAAFDGIHGWGYDGAALFAVHEPYGGPDALKRFVDAAHQHGLAVLLDVVYNHFGPSGNYTGKFGPYVVDEHHTPWGGAVNLEGAYFKCVRTFQIDGATPGSVMLIDHLGAEFTGVIPGRAEMVIDHVEEDRESVLMSRINEALQCIRSTVGFMDREKSDPIVAPTVIARECGDGHQFNVRNAQLFEMVEFADGCIERALGRERADMEFIDDGAGERRCVKFIVGPRK